MPATPPSDLSAETPIPRRTSPHLFAAVRWLSVLALLGVCPVALWLAGLPVSRWLRPPSAADPTRALVLLTGTLVGGLAVLSTLRLWEERIGRARAARYRAWARGRQEAQREQAEAMAEAMARAAAEKAPVADAILVVDLVQSTELIAERGDVFFRDLLRRIETAFIPVARRCGTRSVDGHGDGFLFCFESVDQALEALRGMYARLPTLNGDMPPGVEIAFRASVHVGPTFADTRGNRTGLAVLKAVRLGSVMETLYGRGGGRNSLIVSDEARAALGPASASARLLGQVELRGFPGRHAVYQLEV